MNAITSVEYEESLLKWCTKCKQRGHYAHEHNLIYEKSRENQVKT